MLFSLIHSSDHLMPFVAGYDQKVRDHLPDIKDRESRQIGRIFDISGMLMAGVALIYFLRTLILTLVHYSKYTKIRSYLF